MATENETVSVGLESNGYDIFIGPNELQRLGDLYRKLVGDRHAIVITDNNVAGHYLDQVVDALQTVSKRVDSIVVAAGEKSKSIQQCDNLWQKMMELKGDRSSLVVALGGGVIGDLAGFAAAGFMRGIPFIQIPTSLMAQVDSSVGGKTGVNLPQGKNLVGAFHQPEFVLIQTSTLDTLDDRNFCAGMAEVIKYGMIMDAEFFEFLESNADAIVSRDEQILRQMIATCCRCKARVVEEDEREITGRRAILNYGHTFGHAVESVYGYGTYLHGEAVGIGMRCAARLAETQGMISQEVVDRQNRLLDRVGLAHKLVPTGTRIRLLLFGQNKLEKYEQILAAMKHDKKSAGGAPQLILPDRLGNVKLYDWPGDEVVKAALSEP